MRGTGSMCARGKDMARLGAGINLYLNLQCYLIVLMAILTVLYVPAFLMATSGSRITEEEMDPLGLAKFTMGNSGSAEVATSGNTTALTNTTSFVTLAGRTMESAEASKLLTAADFLGSVVFLGFLLFFKTRIVALSHSLSDHTVSIGDFAVFVKGLPPTATAAEVRDHFSALYDLSKPSWTWKGYCGCCRINGRREPLPPVPSKSPVKDVSNTGDEQYLDKWVCEVAMATRNGSTIRVFRKMDGLLNRVTEAKYAVQRYKADSKHADAGGCAGVCGGVPVHVHRVLMA